MELWVLDKPGDLTPERQIALDPRRHRTGDIWHARLPEDHPHRCYLFRVPTPLDTGPLLLDPTASLVIRWPESVKPEESGGTGPARPAVFAGVVVDHRFDWQGVSPPRHPWSESVLYETHVRGMTMHASAGSGHPGQYLGLIDRIPYLQSLGVTAVELLPVQAFLDGTAPPDIARSEERRVG